MSNEIIWPHGLTAQDAVSIPLHQFIGWVGQAMPREITFQESWLVNPIADLAKADPRLNGQKDSLFDALGIWHENCRFTHDGVDKFNRGLLLIAQHRAAIANYRPRHHTYIHSDPSIQVNTTVAAPSPPPANIQAPWLRM